MIYASVGGQIVPTKKSAIGLQHRLMNMVKPIL